MSNISKQHDGDLDIQTNEIRNVSMPGTSLHFKAGKAHGPQTTKNGCKLLVLWTERTSKEAADLSDFTLATQKAA